MTEKTRTPSGSRRRRPTGYECWSLREMSFVVVHTMAVLKKSRAASTREASTERELVRTMTAIFPARRIVFAARLMYIAIITTRLPLSSLLPSGCSNSHALGPSSALAPSKGAFSSGTL